MFNYQQGNINDSFFQNKELQRNIRKRVLKRWVERLDKELKHEYEIKSRGFETYSLIDYNPIDFSVELHNGRKLSVIPDYHKYGFMEIMEMTDGFEEFPTRYLDINSVILELQTMECER